jgi:hypothetical protein
MELWIIIVSAYITTWIMMIYRTWSISMYMIEKKQPSNLMIKYRKVAFLIYMLCMMPLVPLIPYIALNNKARNRFVLSYVHAITREQQ